MESIDDVVPCSTTTIITGSDRLVVNQRRSINGFVDFVAAPADAAASMAGYYIVLLSSCPGG
jgi:hypothetical protein